MNINLIVIKGRFSLTEGGIVDFYRFCREFLQKHGIVNRGGRADFYCLGNLVISVTPGWLPNRFLGCEYRFGSWNKLKRYYEELERPFYLLPVVLLKLSTERWSCISAGSFPWIKQRWLKDLRSFYKSDLRSIASIWLWSKYHEV